MNLGTNMPRRAFGEANWNVDTVGRKCVQRHAVAGNGSQPGMLAAWCFLGQR